MGTGVSEWIYLEKLQKELILDQLFGLQNTYRSNSMKLIISLTCAGLLLFGNGIANFTAEKYEMNSAGNPNMSNDDFEYAGMTMTEAEESLEKKTPQEIWHVRWSFVFDSAKNKSYERLVESISEAGDVSNVLITLSHIPSADPPLDLKSVVGDPRVGELYRLLSLLSQEEAVAKCKSLFQNKFRVFRFQCEKNRHTESGPVSVQNRHALLAALFLSSQFCDAQTFDELMCEWLVWHASQTDVGIGFKRHAGPQAIETLNLYAFALYKQGKTIDDIRQRLNEILCPLFDQEPAHPGTICMMKLNNGQIALLECPLFITWSRPTKFLRLDGFGIKHYRVVQKCRHWLNPPSLVEQGISQGTDLAVQELQRYGAQLDEYLRTVQGISDPNNP
jgi:hypothetical protein